MGLDPYFCSWFFILHWCSFRNGARAKTVANGAMPALSQATVGSPEPAAFGGQGPPGGPRAKGTHTIIHVMDDWMTITLRIVTNPRCSMHGRFTDIETPKIWPSFVGKYSSTMVRIWQW